MPIGLNAVVDRGINTALTRRLGLPSDATVSLMPELAPTLQLGALPEMDFHMGWRKYMTSGNQPAGGAATFATFQFRMPRPTGPGAQTILVIENVYMSNTPPPLVAQQIKVAGLIATTDLTVALGAQVRDTLQPASRPGVTLVSRGTTADIGIGAGTAYNTFAQRSNEAVFPLVVRPSLIAGTALDGYIFQFDVANVDVNFGLVWRERTMNDQENVP